MKAIKRQIVEDDETEDEEWNSECSSNTFEPEIDSSNFEKLERSPRKFILPDVPDNASVLEKDIKMILPQPLNYGHTKRQNSDYHFQISFESIDIR
ncbi:hypothetical protein QE152_g38234 [Popillia japonica]|uniref:Uncharacterized protein n=1 Tax=Popillia japonica TaxID=7064 RepID=A0AAW1I6Z5_POPJA